jgi:hypothetical protein
MIGRITVDPLETVNAGIVFEAFEIDQKAYA